MMKVISIGILHYFLLLSPLSALATGTSNAENSILLRGYENNNKDNNINDNNGMSEGLSEQKMSSLEPNNVGRLLKGRRKKEPRSSKSETSSSPSRSNDNRDRNRMEYTALIEVTGQPGQVSKRTIKAVERSIKDIYNAFDASVTIRSVDVDVRSITSIGSYEFLNDKDTGFTTRSFTWLLQIEAICDGDCPASIFDGDSMTTRRELNQHRKLTAAENLPSQEEFLDVLIALRPPTGIASFVAITNAQQTSCPAENDVTVVRGVVLLSVEADLDQATDNQIDTFQTAFTATYNELNFQNISICDPSLRLMTASIVDLDYSDIVTTSASRRQLKRSRSSKSSRDRTSRTSTSSTSSSSTSSSSNDGSSTPLMTSAQRIGVEYSILCTGSSCDDGLFTPNSSTMRRMRRQLAGKENERHDHHLPIEENFVLERPLLPTNINSDKPRTLYDVPEDLSPSNAIIVNDNSRRLMAFDDQPSYPLCVCPDNAEERGPYNADFFAVLSETVDILVDEGQLRFIQGLLASTGVEEVPCDAELIDRTWEVTISVLIVEGTEISDADLQALADAYVLAYNIAQASTCDTFFRTTVSATVDEVVIQVNRKLKNKGKQSKQSPLSTSLTTDRDLQTVVLVRVDIYIVIVGTCLGCPDDAPLTNDVSARKLQNYDVSQLEAIADIRSLQQQNDSCYCPIDPVTIGAPSDDSVFAVYETIIEELIEDGVITTVTEVIDAVSGDPDPCNIESDISSPFLIGALAPFDTEISEITNAELQLIANAYVEAYNFVQASNNACDIFNRIAATATVDPFLESEGGEEETFINFLIYVDGTCVECSPNSYFTEFFGERPFRRQLFVVEEECFCQDAIDQPFRPPTEGEVFERFSFLISELIEMEAIVSFTEVVSAVEIRGFETSAPIETFNPESTSFPGSSPPLETTGPSPAPRFV